MVKEFWKDTNHNHLHIWKEPTLWGMVEDDASRDAIWSELPKRHIKAQEGEDIIRWGHKTKGTFTTKEAYLLQTQRQMEPPDPLSMRIWESNFW